MAIKKQGYIFILAIVISLSVITIRAFSIFWIDPSSFLVRVLALWGYAILAIAALTTPFLKEITQAYGKPFIKIHHIFSVFGLTFTTLHPVAYAIQVLSLTVFLPRFDSWEIFWSLAGRPALIILYIALFAALLRRKSRKYWRFFHALMYIVLFLGIVHANLMGTDFQDAGIRIIFDILFLSSVTAFALKRYRNYRIRQIAKQRSVKE